MNTKEWAERLKGRQYLKETIKEEDRQAETDGIVIVYGASDNIVVFRGGVDDEFEAYDGTIVHISKTGFFKNECDDDECPYFISKLETGVEISVRWCPKDHPEYSWWIDAPFPHEPFDIMEGDEKFCRGIVFRLEDVETS